MLTNRWAVLALLFLVRACVAIQFQSVPPIAPFLIAEMTLSYAQLGLLIGLFMLPGSFFALPGGLLGQRFGGKTVVLTGLALMTLGALLFANSLRFGHAFAIAVAGRLLSGVGGVLVNVQLATIVTDWFSGRELATAMGLQLSGWPFGLAVALATLGGFAVMTSWQAAVYLTAVLPAIACVLLMALYRDLPLRDGAAPAPDRRPPVWALPGRSLGLVTAAGMIWMIWNVGFIVFVSFAPLMLIAGGRAIAEAGLLVSLVFWLSLGSVPLGGFLIDRTGRANLLISGAILGSAAIIFLLPFGRWVVALIVLMGLIRGPCAGGVNALPDEVLTPETRSVGFGVYFTVYYIGVALLAPVAGYLQDLSGTAVAPVLFAGFCIASTAVALLAFRLLQRRWAGLDDPTVETATDSSPGSANNRRRHRAAGPNSRGARDRAG